jgi:hypothetical protein
MRIFIGKRGEDLADRIVPTSDRPEDHIAKLLPAKGVQSFAEGLVGHPSRSDDDTGSVRVQVSDVVSAVVELELALFLHLEPFPAAPIPLPAAVVVQFLRQLRR